MKTLQPDLCVIGAGSGGLSLSAGAVQMGAEVVLLENHLMGGDCLNYGCVPSKSLLAAAKSAYNMQSSDAYGIQSTIPKVDFAKVNQHIKSVIAGIAPHDSVERFTELGVKVLTQSGEFINEQEFETPEYLIKAKRFIVATGSRAFIPEIDGLADIDFLTNETIFELTTLPKHLIVIGAGPIGCEMAQAHRYLGAKVTIVANSGLLAKDDPDCVDVVRRQFKKDGIDLFEHVDITRVQKVGDEISLNVNIHGEQKVLTGSHLLVATGRRANVENLGLPKAGVIHDSRGIKIDARMRSTNKRIFAIGDVAEGPQFTHAANYHAGAVIQNILFRLPSKPQYHAFPWVTYTNPEIAQVGMTAKQAAEFDERSQCLTFPYAENDRARAQLKTDGLIKLMVSAKGRVLGASIAGENAGELLLPWSLMINQKLKLSAMARCVVAYPTLSEINKRIAGQYYTPSLFSARTQKIVKFLLRWMR